MSHLFFISLGFFIASLAIQQKIGIFFNVYPIFLMYGVEVKRDG